MKEETKKNGNVVTFYSYKGGTGRSMALANVAVLLAQSGKKVLMIDWDLEAPGLPKYFKQFLPKDFDQRDGLIDFFRLADQKLPEIKFDSDDEARLDKFFPRTQDYIVPIKATRTANNLFLLKAGREKEEGYADQIGSFNWEQFFYKIRSFFTKWAQHLSEQYDFVLIDSRTGHTDTGGICTMQMPDKLVLVFTPNQQSFEGISNLARKAVQYRRRSHDSRPLMVYFLPSRIELNEDKLREKWLLNYRDEITNLYRSLYDLPEISVENYVNQIQVRHASSYAYEEKLAVLEEKVEDKNSLSEVYRDFVGLLQGEIPVWMFGMNGKQKLPVSMFVTYSRKDLQFLHELQKHMRPLFMVGKVDMWYDGNLEAGSDWENEIKERLHHADIILVLVSADALDSEYMWSKEIKIALERHTKGECIVVPVILRACLWAQTPLANLQALPNGAKPIASWPDRDEAYNNVVSYLSQIIEDIHARNDKIRPH